MTNQKLLPLPPLLKIKDFLLSIPNKNKLEKYIDDLHYYVFFISTDPTKEIQINPTSNINDYQFQERVIGNKYLFKATNK